MDVLYFHQTCICLLMGQLRASSLLCLTSPSVLRPLRCVWCRLQKSRSYRWNGCTQTSHLPSSPLRYEIEAASLFKYTSGRWIYNEALRLSERHVSFDVQELKRIAAESISKKAEDILSFQKLAEGGFNRVFQIMMRDGSQLIARVPYHSAIPKHFMIASEVATMDFLRSHGVPVPKVFAYSARSENAVGAEYIIMEMLTGRNIGEYWYSMTEQERLKIIFQIARIEGQLFSISLPANGSIYYVDDLDSSVRRIEFPDSGFRGRFCIGPATSTALWYRERSLLNVDRGPFTTPDDVLKAGANKEKAFLTKYGQNRHPENRLTREIFGYRAQSPIPYVKELEKFLLIARHISPEKNSFLSRPTIRHPDLNPNNILVSDSFDIVGLIDWQHCSILPLFLQCGIPTYFQNYGDDHSESIIKPELPENFVDFDEQHKAEALEVFQKRQLHYYYLAATVKHNKPHFHALRKDSGTLLQRLFTHASNPWQGENVTLRADLIDATKHWPKLALPEVDGTVPACPISYSEADVLECLDLAQKVREMDDQMESMKESLGTGPDGWTPNERFDACRALNAKMKTYALEFAESDFERHMLERHWPFDEQNEQE